MLLAIATGAGVVPARASEAEDPPAQVRPHRVRFDRMETWQIRRRFDFGTETSPVAPACTQFYAAAANPWISWGKGMVRGVVRDSTGNPYLVDGIEGERADLKIRVDRGVPVRVVFTLGDAVSPRGPVDVFVRDQAVATGVETAAGEFMDVDVQVSHPDSALWVRFDAPSCRTFAVAGVAVFGVGTAPRRPRANVSSKFDPPPFVSPRAESLDARAARTLRRLCDYLVEEAPREGGFSREGSWYECAYPVRTLLAGSRLLGEARYREAAVACVDRFLSERLPGGGWNAHYFGTAGCPIAESTRGAGVSLNLADVGSMALVLPLAAAAEPSRRDAYLAAARAYADSVVLPVQLPTGAFPNLTFEGVEYHHPYSVATGLQGAFLAALGKATEEARYTEAAERAGRFLAREVEAEGLVRFHPHDRDSVLLLSADRLGDLFYVLEGMVWIERTVEGPVREELRGALNRFFHAAELKERWESPEGWITEGSPWELSKRAGLLYLLALHAASGEDSRAALAPSLPRYFGLIEDPVWSARLGVAAPPGASNGRYALVATGFAGLGAASLADPTLLFALAP